MVQSHCTRQLSPINQECACSGNSRVAQTAAPRVLARALLSLLEKGLLDAMCGHGLPGGAAMPAILCMHATARHATACLGHGVGGHMTVQVAFCCGVSTAVGYQFMPCRCVSVVVVVSFVLQSPKQQPGRAAPHAACLAATVRVCGAAEAARWLGSFFWFGCWCGRLLSVPWRQSALTCLQLCSHVPACALFWSRTFSPPTNRSARSVCTCVCWQHQRCLLFCSGSPLAGQRTAHGVGLGAAFCS